MSSERVDISYLKSGTPQVIMRRGFHNKGRPRIVPLEAKTPSQFRKELGKSVKDMTKLQRKSYNRLASRLTYAKEKTKVEAGLTAKDYKKKINKPIKKFNKSQLKEYNRLSKIENRIKNNLSY
jgi:exonuclease VII large subunit